MESIEPSDAEDSQEFNDIQARLKGFLLKNPHMDTKIKEVVDNTLSLAKLQSETLKALNAELKSVRKVISDSKKYEKELLSNVKSVKNNALTHPLTEMVPQEPSPSSATASSHHVKAISSTRRLRPAPEMEKYTTPATKKVCVKGIISEHEKLAKEDISQLYECLKENGEDLNANCWKDLKPNWSFSKQFLGAREGASADLIPCMGLASLFSNTRLKLFKQYGNYDDLEVVIHEVSVKGSDNLLVRTKRCETIAKTNEKCENCSKYAKTRQLQERIRGMAIIEDAVAEMESFTFKSRGFEAVKAIIGMPTNYMNPERSVLVERAKLYLELVDYQEKNFQLLKNNDVQVVDANGRIRKDSFFMKFDEVNNRMNHSDDLLIKSVMARNGGHYNAAASDKLRTFFIMIKSLSPRVYTLFKNKFARYSTRHLKRLSTSSSSKETTSVLNVDDKSIKERLQEWLNKVRENSNGTVVLGMCVDATKVASKIDAFYPNNIIVGRKALYVDGRDSGHMIEMDTSNHEKQLFDIVEETTSSDLATEIKCAVVTSHSVRDGASPMKLLAARPQSCNEECNHYNNSLVHAADGIRNAHVVSIAFDGLAVDTKFIYDNLIGFLLSKSNTVAFVDPNHAAKYMRGQIVFGSSLLTAGDGLVDPHLFKEVGLLKDVYRVSDFASNALVLKLCSVETIEKLEKLSNHHRESVVATIFTISFLRLFLAAVNGVGIRYDDRVSMIWASLMWFTSVKGIHRTTISNFVSSGVAAICLVVQKKVKKMRLLTSEPCEHLFDHARQFGQKEEFRVSDFLSFIGKLTDVFEGVMMGLKTNTSTTGYMSGFKGFADSINGVRANDDATTNDDVSDGVDIDYEVPIAVQIEGEVVSIINQTQYEMLKVLRALNVADKESVPSPLCGCIDSMADLARVVATFYRRTVVAGSKHSVTPFHHSHAVTTTDCSEDDAEENRCSSSLPDVEKVLQSLNNFEEEDDVGATTRYVEQVLSSTSTSDCFLRVDVEEFRNWMECPGEDIDILTRMKKYMTRASIQTMNSLQGRWFGKLLQQSTDDSQDKKLLKRNVVVKIHSDYYKVTSVYAKSYNKWRIEDSVLANSNSKIHLAKVYLARPNRIQIDTKSAIKHRFVIKKASECSSIVGFIHTERAN